MGQQRPSLLQRSLYLKKKHTRNSGAYAHTARTTGMMSSLAYVTVEEIVRRSELLGGAQTVVIAHGVLLHTRNGIELNTPRYVSNDQMIK